MNPSGIKIELTRSQIDQVVRNSSEGNGVAAVLRGLSEKGLVSNYETLAASPRLSRSLLLGLLVLACFPVDGEALAVTDVATRLDLSPSTTHRYMTTLLAAGLLEQDPRSRRYRVPLAA
ncbi:MAG TPA: helix-turn-helix domain-containing protein [Solirubrobacteraceae bacterium]|nr:helix-turn-helix domain-containing protein [Solirubrobacteraceae bacterium]